MAAINPPVPCGVVYFIREPNSSIGLYQCWSHPRFKVERLGDCIEVTLYESDSLHIAPSAPPSPLDKPPAAG